MSALHDPAPMARQTQRVGPACACTAPQKRSLHRGHGGHKYAIACDPPPVCHQMTVAPAPWGRRRGARHSTKQRTRIKLLHEGRAGGGQ